MKVNPSGKLESVLVDELVPVDESVSPFLMKPYNHEEGLYQESVGTPSGSKYSPSKEKSTKRKKTLELEVDIWPHLLSKALCKSLGCYERLLSQSIENVISDVTGMPVKVHRTQEVDFEFVRQCFKRGFIVVG